MRSPIIFFLVGTLLLAVASASPARTAPSPVLAQPDSSIPTSAWDSLVQAYRSVKTAESAGAPHNSIERLSGDLNIALGYYENSTAYAAANDTIRAADYAALSANESSNVTLEANGLYATAQAQTLQRQELVYGVAFFAALLSSTVIIEKDRIETFLRRKTVAGTSAD